MFRRRECLNNEEGDRATPELPDDSLLFCEMYGVRVAAYVKDPNRSL